MADDDLKRAEFEAVYSNHYLSLLRVVFLITGERGLAEEIVQDAFTKLLADHHRRDEVRVPEAWLRTVSVRDAVRLVKRRRRLPRLEARTSAESPPTRDLDLWGALKTLPPRQRAVVVLYYYEDRPVAEIARSLGLRESTVRVHLHKAIAQLRSLVGERED